MNQKIPRLRMIAGPNGAGKSTIRTVIPHQLLGIYVNPDEIELELKSQKGLNLNLLLDAIRNSNRAYVFDNSEFGPGKFYLVAEITEGKNIVLKSETMPAWFKKYVWDRVLSPLFPQ